MPDLLNINKDTILAALEHELKEGHRQLEWKAKHLRRDISEAIEALPHAAQPLNGAEVVASMDFPVPYDIKSGGQIGLNVGGIQGTGYTDIQKEIPKGKYRAFLFLHRIGDIKENKGF